MMEVALVLALGVSAAVLVLTVVGAAIFWFVDRAEAKKMRGYRATMASTYQYSLKECTACERVLLMENFPKWCSDCRSRWQRNNPGMGPL